MNALPSDHPLRARILGEIHSRPFHPLQSPIRLQHFAFLVDAAGARAARESLAAFCASRGVAAPPDGTKLFRAERLGRGLTFEAHGEFITYTFSLACETNQPFTPPPSGLVLPWAELPPPGPLLVAVDCHIVRRKREDVDLEGLFNRSSLAVSGAARGRAAIATDFRADPAGFVRILIMDEGLEPRGAGALAQRVLEIETYRTLALLGLPEAQALAPAISRIEDDLPAIITAMRESQSADESERLLDRLTALAAELEAGAAGSQFRLGATRAYAEIMQARFEAIAETKIDGFSAWSSFLSRRFMPAMRTCETLESRQANLSRKLSRAAQLLRTRVDIDLEKQNTQLLEAMNERSRISLQLQQTVEGLSVAAISYYIVGLVGYAVKGLEKIGWPLDSSLTIALSVPLVVALVWWMVRRIRKRHGH